MTLIADPLEALEEIETFVSWLGRASALRDIFPDYVLNDSRDYADACREIASRRERVIAIADELNLSIARRIVVCLDEEDDLSATAIACQRLFLILDPDGKKEC